MSSYDLCTTRPLNIRPNTFGSSFNSFAGLRAWRFFLPRLRASGDFFLTFPSKREHGGHHNTQRDSWGGWRHGATPNRRGIVSMESLAPKMPNREQDLRHQGASSTGSLITAENPSLTRTVRNRLSQAFGLFTDPGPPPPLPPLCGSFVALKSFVVAGLFRRRRFSWEAAEMDEFTCRNCGGGDRGRVAIYRPFGEVSLSLNRTVTCMVLNANDRRTSCPCHDEFRGPRSDYVRQ
ncbi:uncharacterized protein TNCV_2090111, partial [Trichonephila clavipes]